MAYESPKPDMNNKDYPTSHYLDSIKAKVAQEIADARKAFGLAEDVEIYKDNEQAWRFATPPYQLLSQWKQNKQIDEKEISDLYNDKDLGPDIYHQH